MVDLTIELPEDLVRMMRMHPEVVWEDIALDAIREHAFLLVAQQPAMHRLWSSPADDAWDDA